MSTVTWVAGTNASFVTATSVSQTTPSSIQDGDGLFAFVFARSTVTPPSGWTLVTSIACVALTTTQTLYCYRKNTVTSSDSSTSFTWSQSASNRMGMCYALLRADSGTVAAVAEVFTNNLDNATAGSIATAAMTASRGQEVVLAVATVTNTSGSYSPTAPTGMTRWTATAADNRLAGAYVELDEGQSSSGADFVMSAVTGSNGLASITLRVRDAVLDVDGTDTLSIGQSEDVSGSTYSGTTEDSFLATDFAGYGDFFLEDVIEQLDISESVIGKLTTFRETLLEAVNLTPGLTAINRVARALTSSFRAQSFVFSVYRHNMALSDTTNVSSETLEKIYLTRSVLEQIAVQETVQKNLFLRDTLNDAIRLSDRLIAGVPVTVQEEFELALSIDVVRALALVERLGISRSVSASASYGMSVIELVRFVDALRRFFSGDVTEGLGLSDTLLDKKNVYPVLQDTLNLDPDVNRSMVFRVVAPESFAIDDVDALKLIFAPTLSDVVDIAAAYISPGNSITTWAVNAKTGAVSEYQSFDFNSFARVGNTYVAANSTGLYELAGDTDDGDDIISTIRSGFMQLAGSNFTALRDAYLGMRGDGTYILRVITGDGNTYNYSFAADSMRSSKVPLGKGMRARYIAFELVNAGDDFDLDAVEFIPLASKRRV